jgi:5-methyltetrahydrofolate--homocysteine methyltransferase
MEKFLRLIAGESDIARVPVMVGQLEVEVIEAGLKCLQGRESSIRSASRKAKRNSSPGQADPPLRRAWSVMAFDERGRPTRSSEKSKFAPRLQDSRRASRLSAAGYYLRSEHPDVGTGIEEHNNYAVNFIEATRWIKRNLPLRK